MKRTVTRRTILGSGVEFEIPSHSLDLALVAHAAAVETLQIDLVAKGWVGMFGALLAPGSDSSPLVWAADGPGGEAEIKRAYSGLFGRFFGRAVLRHEHGCVGLRQVRDGMELAPGIHLHRKIPGLRGDLPDWVGWSPSKGCFSICEAKGSHEKASWSGRHPPILEAADDQLNRVHVLDSAGRLQTKDWVVASRWGTVVNAKDTTIITVDPLTEGRALSRAEARRAGRSAYVLWLADLLEGMGRSAIAEGLRNDGGLNRALEDGELTEIDGRQVYAALVIDGGGIFPLKAAGGRERMNILRGVARDRDAKAAIIGIDAAAVRKPKLPRRVTAAEAIVEEDRRTVISDDVLLTWNLDTIKLG